MAKTPRFSDRDLLFLILPIITERLLSMLIGITDTVMISYAGETAVAGISLVNQINNVFILIFGALSTGGAVIASQYIGCGDRERSITAASQLMMFTALVSIVLMMCIMLFRLSLMNLLFGRIEDGVRTAADTYIMFTALSFPALAIFNSSAAYGAQNDEVKLTVNDPVISGSKIEYSMSAAGNTDDMYIIAALGSHTTDEYGEKEYPRPAVIIMQYTGHDEVTGNEPPTYNCVGTNDGIASYRTMQSRIELIKANGTDAMIEIFDGLPHGFGMGEGTIAYGWLDNAVEFWERNMSK